MKSAITKDGRIRDLKAFMGPVELRQAVIDAVFQWRYHPYTDYNGKFVDTETSVTVHCKMGNKKEKAAAQAKAQAALAKAAADSTSQPPPDITSPKN